MDELGRLFQEDRDLFLAMGTTNLLPTTLIDGPLSPGTERFPPALNTTALTA